MPLDATNLPIELHVKQGLAFNSEATELLYGGAAGGGKSYLMRAAAIVWAATIPGLQIYLFRRVMDDLTRNHVEGPKGFRAMLSNWVQAKLVTVVENEIRFWTGSKIYLCHCNEEKDVYKYQGAEMHVLMVDEITHFTESMYRFLRNRVRMVGLTLPANYKDRFPRIICSGNPGNIGHMWVKAAWIDDAVPFELRQMSDESGGMLRQFIPALLEDNPSMASDDPKYGARTIGLGGALAQAMRWGNWDIVDGAFFDCWNPRRHIIRPFEMPAHWLRFRSGDWGSAKPFSFGWWAVVSDDHRTEEGLLLPRGCIVRYREWYGCQKSADGKSIPNVGLKLPAEDIGAKLLDLEKLDPKIAYGVLDPNTFEESGGPSYAHRMMKGSGNKVLWRKADNTRIARVGAMGSWDTMRARLIGDSEESPMLVVFNTCLDTIRTVPALQHDPHRPEDVNTAMEDHAGDEIRYACNSRPWVRDKPREIIPIDSWTRAAARQSQLEGVGDGGWKVA